MHTHTHMFNGPLSRTTRVGRYQKGKTNLDFTEARDSEWQWNPLGNMQVCTLLQADNHASFLQAGCPSCRPTNSIKALKALCTLNSNLLMPWLMYIQCNLTQNGLHKAIRLSYPTLLLWVAVLSTNMVKIKYARPKILADHLVGSRGPQFGNHCRRLFHHIDNCSCNWHIPPRGIPRAHHKTNTSLYSGGHGLTRTKMLSVGNDK